MNPMIQGVITIIVGVGGCVGYFYFANLLTVFFLQGPCQTIWSYGVDCSGGLQSLPSLCCRQYSRKQADTWNGTWLVCTLPWMGALIGRVAVRP